MAQLQGNGDLSVDDFRHAESGSDVDSNSQLEVMFTPDSNYRRKSSLVSSDYPSIGQRRGEPGNKYTACFVHSLLNGQWLAPREAFEELDKLTKQRSVDKESTIDAPKVEDRQEDAVSVVDYGNQLPEKGAPSVVHSRHLTKRQLSDMAWNVRKLSKRLGSIKLKLTVKTVFLVTKVYDASLIKSTNEVARWLLSKDRGSQYTVYVEDLLKDHPCFNEKSILDEIPSASAHLKYWNAKLAVEKPQIFDFVVTLGGDGTVLYTSWLFQRIVPPVLSFSLGSLGFLTKFDFNDYQNILSKAFQEGLIVSLRLRFECTVMRANPRKSAHTEGRDLVEELIGEEISDCLTHTPDRVYEILNDVVVDRGPNPTMSTIELFGDDEHFTTVLADGVCIATPTGSTAYNLAAGGALSHPENPVILVTAICAHTLSFRPIILPDTIVLRMGVPYDTRTTSWASFDGRERVELHPGDYVTVSASRYPFANVLPPGRRSEDWVNSISKTLNWNSRQRQKAFK